MKFMKKIIPFLVFLLPVIQVSGSDVHAFTKTADNFLKKHVANGIVDYSAIKKNNTEIESLYKSIGNISLDNTDNNIKKAFFINAYNLIVIHSIVTNFPVKSPMDISGFFDKKTHLVAGESLTLNMLEKEKLMKPYGDARFHFVLVCAAKSCPPLMSGAFTPDQLEQQLQKRTELTINDNNWLVITPSKNSVSVSKIFEWYIEDFTRNGNNLLTWINNYRKNKIPSSYKVNYYEYDWTLND